MYYLNNYLNKKYSNSLIVNNYNISSSCVQNDSVTTRFGNLSGFETGTSHFATSMVLSWAAHLETHVGLHTLHTDAHLAFTRMMHCITISAHKHPFLRWEASRFETGSFPSNAAFIWFWESHVFTMYTTSAYRVHTLCAFM